MMNILGLILSLIVSLEADFVQTKQVALMNEPQVSTGHLSYRAPEYMRWEYTSPQATVWEIDGKQSNVNPQVQRLLRMIMASIAGENTQDERMQRESQKLFRSVNVTMDEKTHAAQRVEMIEKNGDTTIIEFKNVTVK